MNPVETLICSWLGHKIKAVKLDDVVAHIECFRCHRIFPPNYFFMVKKGRVYSWDKKLPDDAKRIELK